ncbi:hypothetical protein [uncultured Deinococcus sp.]|uniref:hypothetical protein n=1 Tax=uncultured Deinococcus sp. TaxID=158789 RepID=UPI0025FF3C4F|nr:hypothetical protein [uncultured Deinococcus sp.]
MDVLTVNRLELLNFMNGSAGSGHHTAMTAFIGEPLAVGLILHYLTRQNKQPEFISWKVTPGTNRGSRLDAWIADGAGTLYQTEIKMWAGNAIGGLRVKADADAATLLAGGQKQWARLWNSESGQLIADTVSKVLKRMDVPKGYVADDVEPLLCLWWPVNPTDEPGPWFRLPVTRTDEQPFDSLNVFSLTHYLMGLEEDTIDLRMPVVLNRLEWLGRLLSPPGQHWTDVFHARNRIYGDAEVSIIAPSADETDL